MTESVTFDCERQEELRHPAPPEVAISQQSTVDDLQPPAPPPSIRGLVRALLASQSIDNSTKQALIDALNGKG